MVERRVNHHLHEQLQVLTLASLRLLSLVGTEGGDLVLPGLTLRSR
jgi:hypothetical protein